MAIKNKTTYRRSSNDGEENKYAKINSSLIEDVKLNLIQVGIMTYILNQSDEFIINKNYLQSISGLGVITFNKCWKGLMAAGYLDKNRLKGHVEWFVNETPTTIELTTS